jgi:hypothetical protein
VPDTLSDTQRDQLHAELFAGRKIQAIKIYREATGADLKTAKDAVEAIDFELRTQHPDRFENSSSKSGCMTMLLLLLSPLAAWLWA